MGDIKAIINFAALVDGLDDPPRWAIDIVESIPTQASGTARKWFAAHDGVMVATYVLNGEGRVAWSPGLRTVKAGATYSTLDGSRIDHGRVLLASDSMLVLERFGGGSPDVMIYHDNPNL